MLYVVQMPNGTGVKARFSIEGFRGEKKKKLNYCLQTGAVVKDAAMIKHNLDQTATLFHILPHFQSRTD